MKNHNYDDNAAANGAATAGPQAREDARTPEGRPMPFEEFMERMEGYYPGLSAHRAKPHNDPEICEVCLSFLRRLQDRVRYLGKVLGHSDKKGELCRHVTS